MREEFQVHMLNETGISKATDLGQAFSNLLDIIDATIPASRERSVVVTKLQEASYFAKRAVAIQVENQKQA